MVDVSSLNSLYDVMSFIIVYFEGRLGHPSRPSAETLKKEINYRGSKN